jgi:hypothetical protein
MLSVGNVKHAYFATLLEEVRPTPSPRCASNPCSTTIALTTDVVRQKWSATIKRLFSLLFAALICSAMMYTNAQAMRWPTNTWSQSCGFWVHCAADRHTGLDGVAPYGTPIYAPISGTLKEVQYHGGYGGTIIIEARGQGETITLLLGHLDGTTFAVRANTSVGEGQFLAKTAPYKSYWSGGYVDHIHMGIHRGGYYCCGTACGGGWNYLGYANSDCEKTNWYDPNLWVRFTNAFNRVGGEAKLGHPVTDFAIPAGYWQREYDGGSYGRCMLVWNGNPTQIYLVRTGFYNKYVQLGATSSSLLGAPTGDEYVWFCRTDGCYVSRQDFQKGYMVWDCSTVRVYNYSGAQIASLSPASDEGITTPPLSLSIAPNPTHGSPNVHFSLPLAGDVSLCVYDVSGRKIATLLSGSQPAGEQTIAWSRTADDGSRVRAGLYFVRLVTPGQTLTRQVVTLE